MAVQLVLISDSSIPDATLEGCREACAVWANLFGEAVRFWRLDGGAPLGVTLEAALRASTSSAVETVKPFETTSPASMSSAPFVWRQDGRPDWRAMWSDFCGLALFGGPPHRGPESALRAVTEPGGAATDVDAIAEIQRGIWETTGLESEPARPGWLAVRCDSRKMAAWLCATIILENVDAECGGERLLVPASERFALEDEVKSIITVVAKTHHYWVEHARGGRR